MFTVFRCDVRRVPADFLTFTNGGKHSLGEDAALLFFDNTLRADEGSGFSLLVE